MRKGIIFLVLFAFQFLFSQEPEKRGIGLKADAERRLNPFFRKNWALIIGINKYQKAGELKYAVSDAKAVRDLMVSKFGFNPKNIIELYDESATRENIFRAFERLMKETVPDDRVFIFYAGHGITVLLPESKERGYILPVDADPNAPVTTAISTDQLNELSESIPAKHLYFVMDACYGGLIFTRSQPLSAETQNFIEVISTRRARQAITAGGRDQPVFDTGPGGHSVFTFHLIEGLKNGWADLDKNGIITASEIASYILPRVTAESRGQQTPQYGILVGDRGGEFYFIPSPRVSVLEITSEPPDADIFINGRSMGKTPAEIDFREFGSIKVEIKKEGYFDYVKELEISEDFHSISAKLEKASSLAILSNPPGADVYLNGELVGKTPFQIPKIKRTTYSLKITAKDYAPYEAMIDLSQREREVVNVKLEKLKGKVTLVGLIGSADISISDGGNIISRFNRLPLRNVTLTYGTYTLQIKKPGFHSFTQTINVDKPENTYPVRLTPKSKPTSLLFSAVLPGAGQIYMGRTSIGVALVTLGVASASASVFTFSKFADFKSKYEFYSTKYKSADDMDEIEKYYGLMVNSYNDMKKFRTYFMISAGVFSAVWIFNIADALLFSPGSFIDESTLKIGFGGNSLNVRVKF